MTKRDYEFGDAVLNLWQRDFLDLTTKDVAATLFVLATSVMVGEGRAIAEAQHLSEKENQEREVRDDDTGGTRTQ